MNITTATSKTVPLVDQLIRLKQKEDRAALAALRTGLGKQPGRAPRMIPLVARYLQSDEGPRVTAAFLTAALFASHPEQADIGSLGASLWQATKSDSNPNGKHKEAGMEIRLIAAIDADSEDLPRHLEALVSLCKSAGAPIDWHRFYWDVATLLGDDEKKQVIVRTRWAREFWRGPNSSNNNSNELEKNT